MLAQLIRQHASSALASENWNSVATTVSALNLRNPARRCFSVETGLTLAGVGVNWPSVMTLIDEDATGRFLLTKLASEGVEWAHAMTTPYLRSKQGNVLTEAGVNALINLSAPLLYATLTAEECQAAIQADNARLALLVLQQRRQKWDLVSADIRSRIESGTLADDAAVVSAVQAAL